MFGWFRKKGAVPGGPVIVDYDVTIDRPADEVYALIDFADPRNAKRQVGTVTETGPDSFTMQLDMIPDLRFDIAVTEAVAPQVYAFGTTITPRAGRLVHNTERYEIEPTGPASCVLRLVTEATFVEGLRERQFAQEVAMMTMAVHNALAKLKIHAEQGVDAIREIEAQQMA